MTHSYETIRIHVKKLMTTKRGQLATEQLTDLLANLIQMDGDSRFSARMLLDAALEEGHAGAVFSLIQTGGMDI